MSKLRVSATVLVVLWGCSSDDAADDTAVVKTAGAHDASIAEAPADAAATVDAKPVDPSKPDAADAAPIDPIEMPGVFAGVGNHVRHIRSVDDGQHWIDDATDIDQSLQGDAYGIRTVSWGNGTFVAFAAKVLTSPDGKTWTEVTKASGQWLASMLYAQNQWVSSGGYGWLATATTDLGNWTQHPPHADYTTAHHSRAALAHGKVAGADAYVVVDDEGNIFHASDGQTWLPTTGAPIVPAGNTWGTVFTFGGGIFVGILPSGTDSVRSTDGGATWSSNTPFAVGVGGVVYAQGHFTAVGSGHVFTSTDGANWIDHVAATARSADLTYGHGTYLALTGGNIFRSTDGLAWTQVFDNQSNPDQVASIAFGPL